MYSPILPTVVSDSSPKSTSTTTSKTLHELEDCPFQLSTKAHGPLILTELGVLNTQIRASADFFHLPSGILTVGGFKYKWVSLTRQIKMWVYWYILI